MTHAVRWGEALTLALLPALLLASRLAPGDSDGTALGVAPAALAVAGAVEREEGVPWLLARGVGVARGVMTVRVALGVRLGVVHARPPRRAAVPGGQDMRGVGVGVESALGVTEREGTAPTHSRPHRGGAPLLQLPACS